MFESAVLEFSLHFNMLGKSIVQLLILLFSWGAVQSEFITPQVELNYVHRREKRGTVESTECGGDYKIHHGDVKIISPKEGNSYAPNLDCLWTLVAGDSCLPEILCENIDLRQKECETEYLQVSDGLGGEIKLCGQTNTLQEPRRASNKGRDIFLRFKTSSKSEFDRPYKGFICSVSCAKNLKKVTSQKLPPDTITLKENSACICGVKNENDRIVGGVNAREHEFPWQAAFVKPNTRNPVCGGSIINNKFILTAAHCFWFKQSQPADFQVLLHAHLLNFKFLKGYDRNATLGEVGSIKGSGWDLDQKTDKQEKSIRLDIEEIIWHPMFTKLYDYDVALVRVKGTIPLTGPDSPLPICLPPAGAYNVLFDGAIATVSGWGLPHEDAGSTTRLLQKLRVPVIKIPECAAMMPQHVLTRRMICAGFKEGLRDACKGDSGGPLILKLSKFQYTQIGIVSWGEGCAKKEKPGIYSRMTGFTQEAATLHGVKLQWSDSLSCSRFQCLKNYPHLTFH